MRCGSWCLPWSAESGEGGGGGSAVGCARAKEVLRGVYVGTGVVDDVWERQTQEAEEKHKGPVPKLDLAAALRDSRDSVRGPLPHKNTGTDLRDKTRREWLVERDRGV